jgi:phosphoserine phosphatase RsbU/P
MRNDLRRYIDDLTETTATRERIASELSIAREIQLGIVPKLFPAFPDRKDIDLYAVLMPAREVGGDLYDFGLLDDDHLYIAIGDVSGKGVPASLLMAVGKTLLKSTICNLRDPGSALAEVNDEIGADNETCMFITLFCGILNLKTGEFIYANGGHNPPFLVRSAESAEMTGTPSGPALGIIPGSAYTNQSLSMAPGDVLVLYTDGITEAMNPANELYGEDRLSDYIRERFESPAIEIIDGLSRSVNDFADGAEQSDDITALVVRFLGRETQEAEEASSETGSCKTAALSPQSILSLSNRIAELDRLVSWIEDQGKVYSLSASVITDLNLALEEWIVNVISHAFEDEASRWIKLRWWYSKEEIRIEIEDDGKPFDPTLPKPVDISIPLDERPIGGMGIRFIQKRMDGFLYRREDNRNIVTLVKALNGCENSIR